MADQEFEDWKRITRNSMSRVPRLAFCGPSRCGKDEAGNWLHANTPLRFAGSTSHYLLPYVVERLGLSREEAWERRHEMKDTWRAIGDEVRKNDPAKLAREALADADVLGGTRAGIEMRAVNETKLVDLAIWVDRPGVPFDTTMGFGPELCDIVIQNHWDIPTYFLRIRNLCRCIGIPLYADR